jgi:hypothetical protein
MTQSLTRGQIECFANLAESIADTSIPHYDFGLARALEDAAATPDESTPEALKIAMNQAMDGFYDELLGECGEYSRIVKVQDTLSVVAAVFGTLCQEPGLEPKIRAGGPEVLVGILAGSQGFVEGCPAEGWIAECISEEYAPVARLFWAQVDDDGNWREQALAPQLRVDEERAEEGYGCLGCGWWIPVEQRFCSGCHLDTLALAGPGRKTREAGE